MDPNEFLLERIGVADPDVSFPDISFYVREFNLMFLPGKSGYALFIRIRRSSCCFKHYNLYDSYTKICSREI